MSATTHRAAGLAPLTCSGAGVFGVVDREPGAAARQLALRLAWIIEAGAKSGPRLSARGGSGLLSRSAAPCDPVDVVGVAMAHDPESPQDRLPPFFEKRGRSRHRDPLERPVAQAFQAAGGRRRTIAQVHRGEVEGDGVCKPVAVGAAPVAARRRRDSADFFVAHNAEAHSAEAPPRLIEVINDARSVAMEMDLRGSGRDVRDGENRRRSDFRAGGGLGPHTHNVLTMEWIDGIASTTTPAQINRTSICDLGRKVIRVSAPCAARRLLPCRHAFGNLFLDDPWLVAVDFGIMDGSQRSGASSRKSCWASSRATTAASRCISGRLCPAITRSRILRRPSAPSASRSTTASPKKSRWRNVTLLLEVTGLFEMQTRPELILLQKTMVVVEGVARGFDPKLDIWKVADPVVREWIERNLGPIGRIQGAMAGAGDLGRVLAGLPAIAARSVAVLEQLETITREGLTLSPETIAAMGRAEGRKSRWRTLALWIIAATFIGILVAVKQM